MRWAAKGVWKTSLSRSVRNPRPRLGVRPSGPKPTPRVGLGSIDSFLSTDPPDRTGPCEPLFGKGYLHCTVPGTHTRTPTSTHIYQHKRPGFDKCMCHTFLRHTCIHHTCDPTHVLCDTPCTRVLCVRLPQTLGQVTDVDLSFTSESRFRLRASPRISVFQAPAVKNLNPGSYRTPQTVGVSSMPVGTSKTKSSRPPPGSSNVTAIQGVPLASGPSLSRVRPDRLS